MKLNKHFCTQVNHLTGTAPIVRNSSIRDCDTNPYYLRSSFSKASNSIVKTEEAIQRPSERQEKTKKRPATGIVLEVGDSQSIPENLPSSASTTEDTRSFKRTRSKTVSTANSRSGLDHTAVVNDRSAPGTLISSQETKITHNRWQKVSGNELHEETRKLYKETKEVGNLPSRLVDDFHLTLGINQAYKRKIKRGKDNKGQPLSWTCMVLSIWISVISCRLKDDNGVAFVEPKFEVWKNPTAFRIYNSGKISSGTTWEDLCSDDIRKEKFYTWLEDVTDNFEHQEVVEVK